jgi:hypothetical protein
VREVKELVCDLGYLNDVRCWYNVGTDHEQVIPLNINANIVDFFNVVEIYKFEKVHLYVEHMVDHVVLIHEPLFLQARETRVGEGSGGVDKVSKARGGSKGSREGASDLS